MSGSPNQTWDDLPFGEVWQSTGGGNDPHRLTGHIRDEESGNEHTGARSYSSADGRWNTADPVRGGRLNPQTLNRYVYVLNDPVNFFDPTGLTEEPIQGPHTEVVVTASAPPVLPPGLSPLEEQFAGSFASWYGSLAFELYLLEPTIPGISDPQVTSTWFLARNPCQNPSMPSYGALTGIAKSALGTSGQSHWSSLSSAQQASYLNIMAAMAAAGILPATAQVDWQRGIQQDRIHLFVDPATFTESWLVAQGFQRDPLSAVPGNPASYRQGVPFGSLEVTFGGNGQIDVDIDYFNPLWSPQTFLAHQEEVRINHETGSLTNPFAVYNILESSIGRSTGSVRPQYQCTPVGRP